MRINTGDRVLNNSSVSAYYKKEGRVLWAGEVRGTDKACIIWERDKPDTPQTYDQNSGLARKFEVISSAKKGKSGTETKGDGNMNYKFKVQNPDMISAREIGENLSRENPIALCILSDSSAIVVVHSSLLRKASVLSITPPDGYMSYQQSYMTHKEYFSEWMEWARGVVNAPWGEEGNPMTVDVRIPEVV